MNSNWLCNDARRAGRAAASLKDGQSGQSTKDNYFPYGRTKPDGRTFLLTLSEISTFLEISDESPNPAPLSWAEDLVHKNTGHPVKFEF